MELIWVDCLLKWLFSTFQRSNVVNRSSYLQHSPCPYERERLDQELRICGEYGLRNKREIWRVQLVLAKIRKVVEGQEA